MGVDHLKRRLDVSDWLNALKEFDGLLNKSPLAMTASELSRVGSVPEELARQPGMTLVEIMSDEEVINYLLKLIKTINNVSKIESTDQFAQIALQTFTKILSHSLDHLSEIGRLSVRFSDVEDELEQKN